MPGALEWCRLWGHPGLGSGHPEADGGLSDLNEHGNDSLFYSAVEKDFLIAVFQQFSRSAN